MHKAQSRWTTSSPTSRGKDPRQGSNQGTCTAPGENVRGMQDADGAGVPESESAEEAATVVPAQQQQQEQHEMAYLRVTASRPCPGPEWGGVGHARAGALKLSCVASAASRDKCREQERGRGKPEKRRARHDWRETDGAKSRGRGEGRERSGSEECSEWRDEVRVSACVLKHSAVSQARVCKHPLPRHPGVCRNSLPRGISAR